MKNLSLDELKELSILDVLDFLNKKCESYLVEQQVIVPFNVAMSFSFNICLPSDLPLREDQNVKVYIFEFVRHYNRSYSLKNIDPKTDKRFVNEIWSKLFISENSVNDLGYVAENVSIDNLLEMIKFTARLSRIKIFE